MPKATIDQIQTLIEGVDSYLEELRFLLMDLEAQQSPKRRRELALRKAARIISQA